MNRYYGLGEYARQERASSSTPDWLVALNARSDALNRQYGLGDYAVKRDAGGRRRPAGEVVSRSPASPGGSARRCPWSPRA